MGGLSRRAYIIKQLRENSQSPILLVDSGNILFKKNRSKKLQFQDKLAANSIQEMYRTMQYTAVAVGPLDLLAGIEDTLDGFLAGTPWISANILRPDGTRVFPPWVIHESGELRVGIIGLTALPNTSDNSFHIVPWPEVLPEAVDRLSSSCDFIVLLSNMDDEANRLIAADYPEIHLLISANPQKGNMVPAIHNNSLITQTHTRGKYLGSLDIHWPDAPLWKDSMQSEDLLAKTLLVSSRSRISRLSAEATATHTAAYGHTLKRLHKRIDALEKASVEGLLEHGGSFKYSFRALTMNIPETSEVTKIIRELKRSISQKNKALSSHQSPVPDKKIFAGSAECVQCHKRQSEFWRSTGHAQAYATLEQQHQQYNLDCLKCHVTWQRISENSIGRQYLLSLPEELKSVGCEVCHGSALGHTKDSSRLDTFTTITEKTCLPCHGGEMDPSFDFEKAATKITCPSS